MASFDLVHVQLVKEAQMMSDKTLNTPELVTEFMVKELAQRDREVLTLINLNTKAVPINMQIVSMGSINASIVTAREIFKSSILSNAASIILYHNHPSGDYTPSDADINITKKIAIAGHVLGIEVLDHIIVAGRTGKYLSMLEEDLISEHKISMWYRDMIRETKRPEKSAGRIL